MNDNRTIRLTIDMLPSPGHGLPSYIPGCGWIVDDVSSETHRITPDTLHKCTFPLMEGDGINHENP